MSSFSGEQLAGQYRAARQRITELLDGVSPEQEQLVVPTCPDWTVRNLLSHNEGLAADLSAGRRSKDVQAWIDGQVAERSDIDVADQLATWNETTGPAFEAALEQTPQMAALVFDVITHEHDLAGALGVTSDRASDGIPMVMELQARMIAKDLEANGLAPVRIVTEHETYQYGEGEPGLELRGSLFEMFRLTGARRSADQHRASDHDGDIEPYLTGMHHNPLPLTDISE